MGAKKGLQGFSVFHREVVSEWTKYFALFRLRKEKEDALRN